MSAMRCTLSFTITLRWQDAVAVYRRGLELAPKHAETRVALADTLSNLKRYTEAGEEYRAVIAQAEAEVRDTQRDTHTHRDTHRDTQRVHCTSPSPSHLLIQN